MKQSCTAPRKGHKKGSRKEQSCPVHGKKTKHKLGETFSAEDNLVDATQSADMSKNYHHWAVMSNHMHNGTSPGNEAEFYYYSSPRGRMELERRIKQAENYRVKDDRLIKVRSRIIAGEAPEPLDAPSNEELTKLIQQGASTYITNKESADAELMSKGRSFVEASTRHSLINASHEWLSQCTVEEQEAVSQFTSSGCFQIAAYLGESKPDNIPASDFEPASDTAEQYQFLLSALRKAPRIKEPILSYRGTSVSEVNDLLGANFSIDDDTNLEHLAETINMKHKNQPISTDSRWSRLPSSCSVSPRKARSFANKVIIETSLRTFASPTVVGAWGAGEGEVFSNPESDYEISSARVIQRESPYGKESFLVLTVAEKID